MNREKENIIDRGTARNGDLHLKRITNASPSVDDHDYVIRKELIDGLNNMKDNFSKILKSIDALLKAPDGTIPKVFKGSLVASAMFEKDGTVNIDFNKPGNGNPQLMMSSGGHGHLGFLAFTEDNLQILFDCESSLVTPGMMTPRDTTTARILKHTDLLRFMYSNGNTPGVDIPTDFEGFSLDLITGNTTIDHQLFTKESIHVVAGDVNLDSAVGTIRIGGTQVVGPRQTMTTTLLSKVLGAADLTYSTNEMNMINDCTSRVNSCIDRLNELYTIFSGSGHGLHT